MAKGKKRRGRNSRSRGNGTGKGRRRLGSSLNSSAQSRSLRMEQLEDKRMLATYVVNNFGDLEPDQSVTTGSLRDAIQEANANPGFDTVVFADFLFDGVNNLIFEPSIVDANPDVELDGREGGGAIPITDQAGVEILGPGAGLLAIFAGGDNRIFLIDDGNENVSSPVTISGVTLIGGDPNADDADGLGGAIINRESLTIEETQITNNVAPGGGGAIFNDTGNLNVVRSLIRNNFSGRGGGGILNGSLDQDDNLPITTIVNSTITGNFAQGVPADEMPTGYGGGVFNRAGTVFVEQSTVFGNTATVDGGGLASQGFDPELDSPSLADGFESGDLTTLAWNTGGAQSWTVNATDPNNGGFSAQAGAIGNGESSFLEIEVEVEDGMIGDVTYFAKISSEPNDDTLVVSYTPMGGAAVVLNTISGQQDYTEYRHDIPAGMHTIRFEYSKDAADVGGDDTVFIDDFLFRSSNMPMPTVTVGNAVMDIRSSIIVGNEVAGSPNDVSSAGMTDDPVAPFEPQINSRGYNLFGVLTHPITTISTLPITLPTDLANDDLAGVDPTNLFVDTNPNSLSVSPLLADFGGVLPVFMPDVTKVDPGLGINLAIDRGDPNVLVDPIVQIDPLVLADPFLIGAVELDNRGVQFLRVADDAAMRVDIGAVETQIGNFVVGNVADESDGRFRSNEPISEGTFPLNSLVRVSDLSLREAIDQLDRNALAGLGGVQTISFASFLDPITSPDIDPVIGTPAQTILLELGALQITTPVNIVGPTSFQLEIDAEGNDPTPINNNGDGSRVFSNASDFTISDLILRGGDVQEFGGAIFNVGELSLTNVTVLESNSTDRGGAIYVAGGTLLLDSSLIHDNGAAGSGGGIFVATGDVTVNNSTISGNDSAFRGGGIANEGGNLVVRYSTITLNTATSAVGSGVASYRDGAATTDIRSSIISGNTLSDIDHAKAGADNIVSSGYNLIGNGNAVGVFSPAAGDQVNADAMLAPLARLGGPTAVHRLLAGSPAIDAGDPNAAGLGNVPDQDQRGFPFDRIEDGVRIDIGAFEVQNGVLNVGDLTMGADFATFLEALEESNLTPGGDTIVLLPDWAGEIFLDDLEIDGSLEVVASPGQFFFSVDILVNDEDDNSLSDVSFANLRFQDGVRFLSQENLTFANSQFVNNNIVDNPLDPETLEYGGVISLEGNGIVSPKLTIDDSRFTGNSTSGGDNVGGVIYVNDGELEINNSFLSGNSTGVLGGSGGAIYIKDTDFTANYLYLTGNAASAATADGGALYAVDSTVMLNNAIISGNSTGGSNSEGGAIAGKDSDITLVDTSVSFNATVGSQSRGGGIFVDGGSLNIQNGTLALNSTTGISSSGGAIASVGADVTITGTNINNNEVTGLSSHGGGIYFTSGNLSIVDSSVVNNSTTAAGTTGGGIFTETNLNGSQTASIFNSTVSGNTTTHRGGGVYNAGGLLEIDHSTITNNSVPYFGNGGGVASNGDATTSQTVVYSSIIAGNHATGDIVNPNSDVDAVNVPIIPTGTSFASQGYNVIGAGLPIALDVFDVNGQAGDQANVVDPKLDPLGLNGGTTFTHSLDLDSPALNAGDPSALAGIGDVPMFDQRGTGFTRVDLGRIDVGAYESAVGPIVVVSDGPDFDGDDDVDGFDFLAWQRGFGKTSGVTQSDGDANNSGTVDDVDRDIWATDYGTGIGGGPVLLTTGDDESLAAISAPSEPLLPAPVLSASPVQTEEPAPISASFLAGMMVDAGATGEALAPVFDTDNVSEEAENTDARDELFAGFSTLDEDGDLEGLADGSDEAEAEQTAEDQVFDLLGAF